MGYDVNTSGSITIPANRIGELSWALRSDEPPFPVDGHLLVQHADVADVIGHTISDLISDHGDGWDVETHPDRSVTISNWGYSRWSSCFEDLLAVLAEHDATGAYECTGEDDCHWRIVLTDQKVREDYARIVYDHDVDTYGWIAQLQAPDDHQLDRVAVVPSEAAGRDLIATWCRKDFQELTEDCPALAELHPITGDMDSQTVIDTWTTLIGGVKVRIEPVTQLAA